MSSRDFPPAAIPLEPRTPDHGGMSSSGALVLSPAVEERLGRLGLEFLAEFLTRATTAHPERFEPLCELAEVLTKLGRLEEGLVADERLATLAPKDPMVRYNLACSLARLGRIDSALDALELALELGYSDRAHALVDTDLDALRASPRFDAILARLERSSG